MTYVIQNAAIRAPVGELAASPQQKADLETAKTWLVFHQPFFAHLLMTQLPVILTHAVPIAATDGFEIFINPDTFFTKPLPEQAFILAHEILHCIFMDPIIYQHWMKQGKVRVGIRDVDFDMDAAQFSMDYIINAQLKAGGVGRMPSGCLYDEKYSKLGKEAVVDIYEQVLADKPPGNPLDQLLQPGARDPDAPEPKRDDLEWKQQIAAAAEAAKTAGKLPAGFERLIGDILEPKVSWQEHLRATLMRVNGSDGLDWAAADRRMMSRTAVGHENVFFGRPTGFGAGTVVVGVDTSGSIGDAIIGAFFAEMRGIMNDINPRELVVMWCDSKVQRVDYLEEVDELEDLRLKGAPGGGGTAFNPVFKRIERLGLDPDMLVYLTDLYGSFPEDEPTYPVVWGVISDVDKVPFGEVVKIDV